MLDLLKEGLRRVIEAAGADFVAVWEIGTHRMVLFNSKRTGSTLALNVDDVLTGGQDTVHAALAESDARFEEA